MKAHRTLPCPSLPRSLCLVLGVQCLLLSLEDCLFSLPPSHSLTFPPTLEKGWENPMERVADAV